MQWPLGSWSGIFCVETCYNNAPAGVGHEGIVIASAAESWGPCVLAACKEHNRILF